jgi:drug/metabolite transporter (DMT)-like permease
MSESQLGQFLALLSAFSFAFGSVFIAKGAKDRGDKGVLFSVFVTMVFSFLLWIILERGDTGRTTSDNWEAGMIWFVLAGIFAMAFGRTLLYTSIQYLGVTRAGSVKRLTPFFSVLCAAIFLSEPITGIDTIGMLIIAIAFGLLIYKSFSGVESAHSGEKISPINYAWGVGSALAYALAYIARKNGLMEINAPVFGTMISAASGFACFGIAAIFTQTYRDNLRYMFSNLNRWLLFSGIFVSVGQILQFAALYYEKVSTVVMINSLEVFMASFLSVVVFRAERRPDLITYIAALLATIGVIAVAVG